MLKDSFFMLISTAIRLGSSFILFVILARVWGVVEFGQFMYPYTISNILVIIVDYGFSLRLVKDISKNPDNLNKIMVVSTISKIILAIVVMVITFVYGFYFAEGSTSGYLLIITMISAILASFSQFFLLPMRAFSKFEIETRVNMYSNLIHLILSIIIVYLGGNPIAVANGFILSRLFNLGLSYFYYVKTFSFIYFSVFDLKASLKNLKDNFPYALHVAVGTLYMQIDTVFIQHFMDAKGVGVYQASMRILVASLLLIDVFTNVYLPRFSKLDRVSLVEIGIRMNKLMILIGSIGSILLFGLSKWIILVFYGVEYSPAIGILELFAIQLFLKYITSTYGVILTVSNYQRVRAISAVISLFLNIILNIILIPLFGLKGAVFAAIINSIILLLIYMGYSYKIVNSFLLDYSSKFISLFGFLSILAMSILNIFFPLIDTSLLIIFSIVILVYFGCKTEILFFIRKYIIK
jgi:O-antigen/teichoic acid export membrane protein